MVKWQTLFQPMPMAIAQRRQAKFFLVLSYLVALYFGLIALHHGLSDPYIIQDDARQHTFWMLRFLDGDLFPGDLIADYFQSVAPIAYVTSYRLAAAVGISPVLFNKILPLVLGFITTHYCFRLCWLMLPLPTWGPISGFIGALLLNQNLWMHDDLASGTPRAFLYPVFTAFLYYLLQRSFWPCMATIALQGWFYPSTVFIMAGLLVVQAVSQRLRVWQLSRRDLLFYGGGLGVAFVVLLPYAVQFSEYGPVITADAARRLPEFGEFGRSRFFVDRPWEFWLTARRSGIFTWVTPLAGVGAIAAPFVLPARRFQLTQQIRHRAVLLQLVVVSLGLFFLAHGVLFTLHLPSRYTHHSLQVLTAVAGALTWVVLLDALFHPGYSRHPDPSARPRRSLGLATVLLSMVLLLPVPSLFWISPQLFTGQIQGEATELYEFLAQQPKTTLVAALVPEADNLPAFTGRSVLVSREYAIPYHQGYYRQFRQRVQDLLQAQYSGDGQTVVQFIQTYNIDFWLLDQTLLLAPPQLEAQQPWWQALFQNPPAPSQEALSARHQQMAQWLQPFQAFLSSQEQGINAAPPALAQTVDQCTVFESTPLILLDAQCVQDSIAF